MNGLVIAIIVIVILAGIGAGIYFATMRNAGTVGTVSTVGTVGSVSTPSPATAERI